MKDVFKWDELKSDFIHLQKLLFLIYHCAFIKWGTVEDLYSAESEYQWNRACAIVEWSLTCYYYHFNYLCSKLNNITTNIKINTDLSSLTCCFFLQVIFTINQELEFQVLLKKYFTYFWIVPAPSESPYCTVHLKKHLLEQTEYICTNKYKCQELTHKCKHMSLPAPPIWQHDRLKSV